MESKECILYFNQGLEIEWIVPKTYVKWIYGIVYVETRE